MSELPSSWATASLSVLGDLYCGQSPPSSTVNKVGIGTPYVTGPEQWDGSVLHSPKWTTDPRSEVPSDTIFITVKGAGVGTVFSGMECAIGRDVYAYAPSKHLDQRFMLTAVDAVISTVKYSARGDIPGLSRSHLLDPLIGIPPLAEQRRIVAKLDALSARSKRARAELERVEALAERTRQAVLAAAFKGELTAAWRQQHPDVVNAADLVATTPEPGQSRGGREATEDVKPGVAALSVNKPDTTPPRGWCWVSLRRVARQETGHTPSRSRPEYWDGGVPWIGIRDAGAHHGRVIQETLQSISEAGLENSSARLLPAGTVCLSRTASVGYVTILGRSMATSQDFATWTCTAALEPEYLMYALMAEGSQIRNFGEGTTHTTIYFPEIRAFHICLAPKEEQREIVRRVKKALASLGALVAEASGAASLVNRLDQSILSRAFRGELVPQEPTDEPASVLLDRIKMEASGQTPKRRRRAR